MLRSIREIGSEYWIEQAPEVLLEKRDGVYVFSGRTAIDLILQDILKKRLVKSVYMPAWCCDSMLQPFKDRDVDIKFYDIGYENGYIHYDIEETNDVNILYVTNYFGYDNTLPVEIIMRFKQRGVIIIYDRTHSLLREENVLDSIADYTFGSIRKWIGVFSGAYLTKASGHLHESTLNDCPYLVDRVEAMKMKASYMSGNKTINKKDFLDKYRQFAHHLEEDYRNYKMDEKSLKMWLHADKQTLKNERRNNAMMLQKMLEDIPQMKPMFSIEKDDCPLFVPVLLRNKEERDALRRHLTANAIYCPIHWPKPALIEAPMKVNSIYDRELSLICDQRYDIDDMAEIVDVIQKK